MFGKTNYATIVGPLKKMAADLSTYIKEQKETIKTLHGEKTEIESQIQSSESEIAKSEFTTGKIGEMVVLDLYEIAEREEEPPDNDTESET